MPKQRPNATDALIGKRLRNLRETRNTSQSEAGKVLGVTFQQMQKFERGENRISASQLFMIAQHFDVSMDYFFAGAGGVLPKRSVVAPDTEGIAALEFASSKKGFNLLRAIVALESEILRDCVIGFVQQLAKKTARR